MSSDHWAVVGSAYDTFAESEEARLKSGTNPPEFAFSKQLIQEHLPRVTSVIDVGSGPGVYALWLAAQGKRVHLIDVSSRSLLLAQYRAQRAGVTQLISTRVGDAASLTEERDAAYDMALLLGPVYHSPNEAYAEQTIHEAQRVLTPGGVLLLNIANPFAMLKRVYPTESCDTLISILADIRQHGHIRYKNACDDIGTWCCTRAYIESLLARHGLTVTHVAGTKAILQDHEALTLARLKSDFDAIMRLISVTATMDEYIIQSEYIWLIAHKNA